MSTLVIVPARANSKGVPNKNFRELAGLSPLSRALHCAMRVVDSECIVVTTDYPVTLTPGGAGIKLIRRRVCLAKDDTPMIDVVKDVLEQIPGPPDQKIVLLQPTQPLREPKHITQALELLTDEWDSVVSVVEICPVREWVLSIDDGRLERLADWAWLSDGMWTQRQGQQPAYKADGTAYAFWRKTVTEYGDIYGHAVRPLIIPASETCPLDTPEDWAEAERRLMERER